MRVNAIVEVVCSAQVEVNRKYSGDVKRFESQIGAGKRSIFEQQ